MGLDMYLYRKHYVKNWDHMKPDELHAVTVLKGGEATSIKPERVSQITEEVAYWRKANQVHKWFVDNVQSGNDDCGEYYVSREQLKKLHDDVDMALKARHLAADILPTQPGFFFGSTDYDEYYWHDLEATRTALAGVLAEPNEGDFYYHSSW